MNKEFLKFRADFLNVLTTIEKVSYQNAYMKKELELINKKLEGFDLHGSTVNQLDMLIERFATADIGMDKQVDDPIVIQHEEGVKATSYIPNTKYDTDIDVLPSDEEYDNDDWCSCDNYVRV